jgi:energy-coupling factor transporter ATP-binding protein EcfA2
MLEPIGAIRRLYGWDTPFAIDLTKRTAIFGATGSGKSTLLKRVIYGFLRSGQGFTLQDPHGPLFDWTLSMIPKRLLERVIVFAPKPSADAYVQINPLNGAEAYKRGKDTLELIATTWANSWGPQSDFMSRNILEAILEVIPHPTLLHFDRAFMSRDYLARLAQKAKNLHTQNYFKKTLEEWDKRQAEAAAAPPTNKFNTFMQPVLRHTVGGVKGLDFGRLMNDSKILLCRLAVGDLGEDIATILAHLVQQELLHAGLERQKSKRRPFHGLVIDEFHKFTRGRSAEQFLNETRKYNISLTIADQGIDQLPEGAADAIFTNVENLLVSRVSGKDAQKFAEELPIPEPNTLLRLAKFRWYGRIAGNDPVPFDALEEPERTGKEVDPEKVIAFTRSNYAVPKETIETNIYRFLAA